MPRVLIVQPYVPTYRVPLFEQLHATARRRRYRTPGRRATGPWRPDEARRRVDGCVLAGGPFTQRSVGQHLASLEAHSTPRRHGRSRRDRTGQRGTGQLRDCCARQVSGSRRGATATPPRRIRIALTRHSRTGSSAGPSTSLRTPTRAESPLSRPDWPLTESPCFATPWTHDSSAKHSSACRRRASMNSGPATNSVIADGPVSSADSTHPSALSSCSPPVMRSSQRSRSSDSSSPAQEPKRT